MLSVIMSRVVSLSDRRLISTDLAKRWPEAIGFLICRKRFLGFELRECRAWKDSVLLDKQPRIRLDLAKIVQCIEDRKSEKIRRRASAKFPKHKTP